MKTENLKKKIQALKWDGFLDWLMIIQKNKGEVFLVGGAVRDALMGGREIKDYDFVVRGIEIERLGKILARLGRVELVGKNFGVYKFVPACQSGGRTEKKIKTAFDIALPRTEISLATGGYKDFKVSYNHQLDIREDLGRRDFTINAMAWDLEKEKLIDEFDGLADLQDKKIRTVGNPYERFGEDYSRMLRAIRFACQLRFGIEDHTWMAVQKLMQKINEERNGEKIVPREIIGEEMLKAFTGDPLLAFDLLDKSGATMELLPELLKMKKCPQPENWHSEGDVWEHTRVCLNNLRSRAFAERFKQPIIFDGKDKRQKIKKVKRQKVEGKSKEGLISAELVMAILFHDVGKPVKIEMPEKGGANRIRFYNHDVEGARIALDIFKRLKFSAAADFDFKPERAVWLIARHHLFDTKIIEAMKNATIEKYFFSEKHSGEDLLKIGFIDQLSSLRVETGKGDTGNMELMVKRINNLKKIGKDRRLPRALLNGNEVMEILRLKPGKAVGKILEDLREAQLSGKVKSKEQAVIFLKGKKIKKGKRQK